MAGREHVVILMNKLWKRLGSDPNIIGKPIQIDGTPYTVVGVLAPGQADRLDQWLVVPLVFKPEQLNHDFHWLLAMGRLKPGITIKQAQADMDTVTANIAKANPQKQQGLGRLCRTAARTISCPRNESRLCGCCSARSALCS